MGEGVSMSTPTSSHAYGIGAIALIVGLSVTVVYYTSFYLPESLAKPSVDPHILEPEKVFTISIPIDASIEGNEPYSPDDATVLLSIDNKVIWVNDDGTGHTVTPDHRHADSYSGDFGSEGVLQPGDTYEFIFTEPQVITYHCTPHPWMKGTITVEKSRF